MPTIGELLGSGSNAKSTVDTTTRTSNRAREALKMGEIIAKTKEQYPEQPHRAYEIAMTRWQSWASDG